MRKKAHQISYILLNQFDNAAMHQSGSEIRVNHVADGGTMRGGPVY